ncbi:hypothetical protein KM043_016890 [Ampulex compressa]|nr:hypothetical protein KM043_016890 [Ampulex compressa]
MQRKFMAPSRSIYEDDVRGLSEWTNLDRAARGFLPIPRAAQMLRLRCLHLHVLPPAVLGLGPRQDLNLMTGEFLRLRSRSLDLDNAFDKLMARTSVRLFGFGRRFIVSKYESLTVDEPKWELIVQVISNKIQLERNRGIIWR